MAIALLVAARRGDVKIVRRLLRDDITIITEELPNGSTVLDQATEEGLTTLFEVQTTVCHLAASVELTTPICQGLTEGITIIIMLGNHSFTDPNIITSDHGS